MGDDTRGDGLLEGIKTRISEEQIGDGIASHSDLCAVYFQVKYGSCK